MIEQLDEFVQPNVVFRLLADKYGGVFQEETDKIRMHNGISHYYSVYTLDCYHRDVHIHIVYRFTNIPLGHVSCLLPLLPNNCGFIIENHSSFKRLFWRKLPALVVHCQNPQVKHFIEDDSTFLELIEHAKSRRFEPEITGQNLESAFEIRSVLSLGYIGKMESLEPMLLFYKALIDFFLDDLRVYR